MELKKTSRSAVRKKFNVPILHDLEIVNITAMPDAMRDCIAIIDTKSIKPMYESVVVDEGQDMGSQAYETWGARLMS